MSVTATFDTNGRISSVTTESTSRRRRHHIDRLMDIGGALSRIHARSGPDRMISVAHTQYGMSYCTAYNYIRVYRALKGIEIPRGCTVQGLIDVTRESVPNGAQRAAREYLQAGGYINEAVAIDLIQAFSTPTGRVAPQPKATKPLHAEKPATLDLRFDDLDYHPDAQRSLDPDHVQWFVDNWSDSACRLRPMDVVYRAGRYILVDGQHRVTAMRRMGRDKATFRVIYDRGQTDADLSALFLELNPEFTGKPIAIEDRLRIAANAGDARAVLAAAVAMARANGIDLAGIA